MHGGTFIATIAAGLGAAFLLGLVAARVGLPPVVGYLLAGILVGPHTPIGFQADAALASQLAEFGIILLMFGVGLHFSLADLARVRRVVVPGAVLQTLVTGALAGALAIAWGWGAGGAAVLGLAVAVASTVVVLKGLEGMDRLDSAEGRVAVGWLVVEDLMMVLALVLLPALAGALGGRATPGASAATLARDVAIAVGKVAIFTTLMIVVGRRAVPWLLAQVARLGSRELFTLAVLVTALGVGAAASGLFGVSFALGAFFAGAVVAESELSQRAAEEALPMRDAFAVLFFVSVGMLFDPRVLAEQPGRVALLLLLVVVWKSALATGLLRLFGQPPRVALTVGPALGQIGEFSFIVATLGAGLGLVSGEAQGVLVAVALASITLNVPLTRLVARGAARSGWRAGAAEAALAATREHRAAGVPGMTTPAGDDGDVTDFAELEGHVVLVGFGRVGATVAEALSRAGSSHVVVEEQERIVGGLRQRGERAIHGDATRVEVLTRAGIRGARLLVVTAPEPLRARRIVELARALNPDIAVAVRTHSASEQQWYESYLAAPGAMGRAVYAEREAALNLAHYSLMALGRTDDEADLLVDGMRGRPTAPTETFAALQTQEYRALVRQGQAGTAKGKVISED